VFQTEQQEENEMFGYFTKLNGHVYDGAHVAAEDLHNGDFVEITAEGVKKIAEAGDAILRVAPEGKLANYWGHPALALDVVADGSKEYFMVEGEWDINDAEAYNTSEYVTKAGSFVSMRRPVVGDQILRDVSEDIYNAASEGALFTPAADGAIAAKA
jgi:hypothetical protein